MNKKIGWFVLLFLSALVIVYLAYKYQSSKAPLTENDVAKTQDNSMADGAQSGKAQTEEPVTNEEQTNEAQEKNDLQKMNEFYSDKHKSGIKREIKGATKSMVIDAILDIKNANFTNIKTYKLNTVSFNDEFQTPLINAFVGGEDKVENIVNNKQLDFIKYINFSDLNDDDFVQLSKNLSEGTYSIENKNSKDFYPFSDNIKVEALGVMNDQLKEKVELCNNFSNLLELDKFKFLYDIPMGTNGRHEYTILRYAPFIGNMKFYSQHDSNTLLFYVDNDGIQSAKIGSFEVSEEGSVEKLLYLDEAINKLEQYVDVLEIIAEENLSKFQTSDGEDNISEINISKVSFEYVLNPSNQQEVVPAWRFYLKVSDNAVDNEIFIGVNAVNGDVILTRRHKRGL